MRIETKFNQCLENMEREKGESISLKEISNETSLTEDVLNLIRTSHYNDISNLALSDIITVADYFNTTFYDFVKIEDRITSCSEENEAADESTTQSLLTPSHCTTGSDFKRALSSSKYYTTYASVPTLIDSMADLIDNNPGVILAGVVENFNIKTISEDVIIRFFAKGDKIFIKNVLFGKAIKLDKRKLFKKIYEEYFHMTGKDSVETANDVSTLVSLINSITI